MELDDLSERDSDMGDFYEDKELLDIQRGDTVNTANTGEQWEEKDKLAYSSRHDEAEAKDDIDDEDLGSEYSKLMRELAQPPKSLRKNAPLNKQHEEYPKNFQKDTQFEIITLDLALKATKNQGTNDMLVPTVVPLSAKQERTLRSPKRGKIRLCHIEFDGTRLNTTRVFGKGYQMYQGNGTMTQSMGNMQNTQSVQNTTQ